jgi:nucleotide-binding universal stress UspA family protein
MKRPIVVGTDLTEASDEALVEAEARATRDEVPITVVHAMSPLLWRAVSDADQMERIGEVIRQQFTALTGRRKNEYEVVVSHGLAHAVLARLAVARQALLVVDTHMHHGVGHTLLECDSKRVVAGVRAPVLFTRRDSTSERILVAVDQPFGSSAVLDAAIDEARSSNAKLTAIHAIDTGLTHSRALDVRNRDVHTVHPVGERQRVVETLQTLRVELRRRRIEADAHVVEGDGSSLIPHVAARIDANLVVVGTALRPGRTSPTTEAVLRNAPCSVLVIDEGSALLSVRSTLLQTVVN